MIVRFIAALLFLLALPAHANEPNPWNEDARALARIINEQYAYLERLPAGKYALTAELQAQADAVRDEKSLLYLAEKALLLLSDHHAITGSSFGDSWAVVPSYSTLWIERSGGIYRITAVRAGSAAEINGIATGDVLKEIGGVPVEKAVAKFWADLGVGQYDDQQAGFAARVLAAGRRDRATEIGFTTSKKMRRSFVSPSLYVGPIKERGVRSFLRDATQVIEINDVLGETETIAAFDSAMALLSPDKPLVIDLTNTASGGNTTVSRAIMGWFVRKPMPYQIHNSPAEERWTGIPRQWVEQVLPREGKYRGSLPTIRVGRWTGSMGEGLAIGLHALGARVEGEPMAGLLGAIEDIKLPNSGLVIKLPTERLHAVDGTPREKFMPVPMETADDRNRTPRRP
jgi:hypothetical protein